MLFRTWYYKLDQTQEAYSVFKVSIAISKKQATYILKKRLKTKTIFDIIACEQMERGKFNA